VIKVLYFCQQSHKVFSIVINICFPDRGWEGVILRMRINANLTIILGM